MEIRHWVFHDETNYAMLRFSMYLDIITGLIPIILTCEVQYHLSWIRSLLPLCLPLVGICWCFNIFYGANFLNPLPLVSLMKETKYDR